MSSSLFRYRGAVLGLLASFALWTAQPSQEGLRWGLALALGGEALRLWAIGYSGQATRAQRLLAPQLVTAGPYAYLRNPLYLGNLLNSAGVLLGAFFPGAASKFLLCLGLVVAFYRSLAAYEEKFLAQRFGSEYAHYRRSVPAWLPQGRRYSRRLGRFEPLNCWRYERSSLMWWGLIWSALLLKGWF